ncbi:MAG: endonuclease NucS domain-containing protein [Gemmatimonadaceae bacterium]
MSLETEALLEQMIVEDPTILSDGWMLIGRQIRTSHAGFIDLLALNADGQLIVIELKRNQTPREVVAQAIDYASWVQGLVSEKIAEIYQEFSNGDSLDEAFRRRFAIDLDEEQLNGSHQVVIVAASLDPSTERIVKYLSDKDVPINVIFFQVFQDGANQFLSRAWLIDPIETEAKAVSPGSSKGEWNGEFYVAFGHGPTRNWDDAVRFGFISAGGGIWYSRTLSLLSPGDRIWVLVPHHGYVGVGRVTGAPTAAKDFAVMVNGVSRPIVEVGNADYKRRADIDEENGEFFVPVEWIETRTLENAVNEVGLFGNQNSVCRPRTSKWNHTVERLKKFFPAVESTANRSPSK